MQAFGPFDLLQSSKLLPNIPYLFGCIMVGYRYDDWEQEYRSTGVQEPPSIAPSLPPFAAWRPQELESV
jgi:hypothetical protein